MFDITKLVRENIRNLVPYSSARDEYKGAEAIFLDANESGYGAPLNESVNRYPDPMQRKLKEKISSIKNIEVDSIFLGNGSDEAIDILFRAFCIPGKDNVILNPPTYGMYEVSANVNNVETRKVSLIPGSFQLDAEKILNAIDENTKLIFVCCPNNPTGTSIKWMDIKRLLENFNGIVVADEAYIDFAGYESLIGELKNYPNLVILQTLSKAWGMAGLRVGMAFASKEIISVFNKIKPPYNINVISQKLAMEALEKNELVKERITEIISERERLKKQCEELNFINKIYPSEANFLLMRMKEPGKTYAFLIDNGIVVRDRSKIALCEGCLRITIGTKVENDTLITALKKYNV
jgi:histidinol-phosphate aminotransferase